MESSVWLVPRNWFKVTGSNSYSLSSDKLVIISLNSSPGIDILHGLVTQKLAVLVSLILNSNFTSSFGHFLFYNLKRWVILAFFKSLDRWLILFLLERKKRKVQRQNWSAASKFEVQRETQSAARAIRNHPKPNIRNQCSSSNYRIVRLGWFRMCSLQRHCSVSSLHPKTWFRFISSDVSKRCIQWTK